jgi:hypothetical protein
VSNYTWSTGNSTTTSIVVSPLTNTTYSVIGTSSLNCQAAAVLNVTVNSGVPSLAIANPSNNICLGRTVSLTATGALTYTWVNAGVVNGQTFTPLTTQAYTVIGQNGCGTSQSTTTITVAPLPVTTLATPTLVCQGYPATLTAVSAVGGYTWQPGPVTGGTIVVAPLANTVYTVTASDGTCSGTQTLSLPTKITPVITAAPSSTKICAGEQVTLTANGAGVGGTYSWSPVGGSNTIVTVSPLSNTLFVVNGTNSLNCTASANFPVVVDQPPVIGVSANKTLVCNGGTVALSASGGSNYQWVNGPVTAGYTVTPTAPLTTYTVTGGHTLNNCIATRTIDIAVLVPNVSVTPGYSVCPGNTVQLTATGANSYTWNNVGVGGTGVFVVQPTASSVYTLIANTTSLSLGCITVHTVTVNLLTLPTVTVGSAKKNICKGETHTLTASGANTYSWSTTQTTSVVTVKPNASTYYTVTGYSADGCETTVVFQALVSACSGITEYEMTKILVYPNPSDGNIRISTGTNANLLLSNALGQIVSSIDFNESNEFSVSLHLSEGIYFVSGESEGRKVVTKIIVRP